jgi:prophage regulatory protein
VRRFIRFLEVQKRVGGASKPTIYRWMQRGTFPRPYPLDDRGHSVAWREEQVDAWIDARIAAREASARVRRAA